MKIAIAGGSGFVGKALTDFFLKKGDEVYILSRKLKPNQPHLTYVEWLSENSKPSSLLEGIDILINLAGESINSGRWNESRKKSILQSRLTSTKEILAIIEQLTNKPRILINASAIGYYGTSEFSTFTEESASIGHDFLAETVKAWEQLALNAENFGVRTVLSRFGIVLARDGGALPKMSLPYKLFAGGKLGKGSQWVSWIHLDDVTRAIDYIIKHENLQGPINFVAPNPVQMNTFGKELSKVLHRPHWFPTPEIALKLTLGEMSLLMLEGQKVYPDKLLKHNFTFRFPTLDLALRDIFEN